MAQAQTYTSYDEFSGGTISPYRWLGDDSAQYGGIPVEGRRAVVSGQLRLETKGYGGNTSGTSQALVRNALYFTNASTLRSMKATITPRIATLSTCAGNTSPGVVRARLFGFFFNAGTPVPRSNYNDVFATIGVSRASNSADGDGIFRVSASVGICTDDSCIATTSLGSQDLGTVALNAATTVSVSWNPASHLFSFQRDAGSAVSIAYTVTDTHSPQNDLKRLEVSNLIPNCTTSRLSVYGGADFDSVFTATN